MPAYGGGNPGPSSEGDSNYSDEPEMDKSGDQPEEKEEGQEYEPFTVPKSAFGGKDPKPGEQYYFDVKSIHEGEVLMEYAPDEKKDEGGEEMEPGEGKPMMGGGDSEMAGMMG